MITINAIVGPRKHFDEKIKDVEDYVTLTQILKEFMIFDNTKHIKVVGQEMEVDSDNAIPKFKNMICFAEEYNAITENLLLSFFQRLSIFGIENYYFQNPPMKLVDQALILKINNDAHVWIDSDYTYNTINKKIIKKLYAEFDNRIVGQTNIKEVIAASLIPLINKKRKKPLIMMFYGPTGVGKTETAKYIAELSGGELFRRQFSMFQNERAYDYLFGGKHGFNTFSYELLNRNSNVILLDEFDKVHPTLFSAFYELFDEGVFNDNMYEVSLEKAILICTSNYKNLDEIKQQLGAPIFSRIDKFVEFKSISNEDKLIIIKDDLSKQLKLLSPRDKETIDEDKVYLLMAEHVENFQDVRKIHKQIRDIIDFQLLQNLLNE